MGGRHAIHVAVVVAAHEQRHFGQGECQQAVFGHFQVGDRQHRVATVLDGHIGPAGGRAKISVADIVLFAHVHGHGDEAQPQLGAVAVAKGLHRIIGNGAAVGLEGDRVFAFRSGQVHHVGRNPIVPALVQAFEQIGFLEVELVVAEGHEIDPDGVHGFHHVFAADRLSVYFERADGRWTEKIPRVDGQGVGVLRRQFALDRRHAGQAGHGPVFHGVDLVHVVEVQQRDLDPVVRTPRPLSGLMGRSAGAGQENQDKKQERKKALHRWDLWSKDTTSWRGERMKKIGWLAGGGACGHLGD